MNKILIESLTEALEPVINEVVDRIAERAWTRMQVIMRPPEPRYYSRIEAAQILRITLPTLQHLTADGRLTAKRVGRRVLYDAAEIDALVAGGEQIKYVRRNSR